MNGKKTFKFKTGKPVKIGQYLMFFPNKEAQEEHTKALQVQEQMLKRIFQGG